MSFVADLERLAGLRCDGVLTAEEYATAKTIVLGEITESPAAGVATTSPRESVGEDAEPRQDTRPQPIRKQPVREERVQPILAALLFGLVFLGAVGIITAVRQPAAEQRPDPPAERVKVIVAAKDLPVGTQLTKDELKNMVKIVEMPKDAAPTGIIETEEELLEKRLTRTIRADEPFNKADVIRGGIVTIPPGMSMVALPISLPHSVAGFIGPGSRVDLLAAVQLQNKVNVLPILVNMLVLAVDANVALPNQDAYQNLSTVSFAVDRKQALLIKLAQARHCDLSLILRNPDEKVSENDKLYDIDKVLQLLQDQRTKNNLVPGYDRDEINRP